MQIIVDVNANDEGDWDSHVAEISFMDDEGGRVYIVFGEETIAINLPDLLKFLGNVAVGEDRR